MSKPDITEKVGGYQFSWPEGINIDISRLKVHNSDGRVTGEILIKNETTVLYPQTQFNFSADRTRDGMAKSLSGRYEAHDWRAIFDQLCYHVQEKARQGEPVQELWTHDDLKPPGYIVEPLIMANQPNVIFGSPESGKTQFAMTLCLVAMLPWHDNHLKLKGPDNTVKVLWLDYEADADSTRYNFSRIVRGANVGALYLPYRRCRFPLADDVESVAHHVSATGANMVVIDSVAKAAAGDLDKSESANRFFGALDQLKCTSLILAHTSKGEGGRKSIYGSVFFEAYARSVWEARSSPNGDEMTIGLWDNKANYRSKHEPLAFKYIYTEDSILIGVEDIKTVDDFVAHLSTKSRIKKALESGAKSPKELKELLSDIPESSIYVELGRMTSRKQIIKLGEGKNISYGLPANTYM